jgi:hypothetical protein
MNLSPDCPINLDVLMQTRALIVAGSGGGKSYALRKLIEETAGGVQQLVIDPEGEFASLRERHDFILVAARDGDIVASPKTAGVLAHRLLELGTSAILDLYELQVHERQLFVKHFLDALVNAPKELWRQVMVVLDEAHVFCPQNGSAMAMQSVIDVATRGRKRGQCLVLATQRLSKLHKDTAAEMQNKLIGLTNLDVDRKRAAEELGMTAKEAVQALRLPRGDFYAFGPALVSDVTKIHVATVKTTHHSGSGKMLKAPPAPSATVKKQLAKLVDLDAAAAQEARTIEELKAEVARLKREAKKPAGDDSAMQALKDERLRMISALAAAEKQLAASRQVLQKIAKLVAIEDIAGPQMQIEVRPAAAPEWKLTDVFPKKSIVECLEQRGGGGTPLKAGARRMLQELAARHPRGWTRRQLGALANISYKSGTFSTYLGVLKSSGYVTEECGEVFATPEGVELFPVKPTATTHEEAMAQWGATLKAGARRMLEVIVAAGEDGIHRANVADAANMVASSGTFSTYLGTLKGRGLVDEHGKKLFANDVLFP